MRVRLPATLAEGDRRVLRAVTAVVDDAMCIALAEGDAERVYRARRARNARVIVAWRALSSR